MRLSRNGHGFHEEALRGALRQYKAIPYPQVGTASCTVYGLCNDRNCDYGHLPRLVGTFVTLGWGRRLSSPFIPSGTARAREEDQCSASLSEPRDGPAPQAD